MTYAALELEANDFAFDAAAFDFDARVLLLLANDFDFDIDAALLLLASAFSFAAAAAFALALTARTSRWRVSVAGAEESTSRMPSASRRLASWRWPDEEPQWSHAAAVAANASTAETKAAGWTMVVRWDEEGLLKECGGNPKR